MNASDFPHLHAYLGRADADEDTEPSPALDPTTLVATLRRIGTGAAADGQPWPERH